MRRILKHTDISSIRIQEEILMIIREHYLKEIRPFYESNLIKILTGIRRCGKSVILEQVMEELQASGKRCVLLDFDQKPVRNRVPDADALISYVNERLREDKLYGEDVSLNSINAERVVFLLILLFLHQDRSDRNQP